MKIIHIINSLATGGAEKLILDTVPLYNKEGFQVDVLVFQNKNYAFQKALEERELCKIYNLQLDSVYNPLSILKMMKILKAYDIAHVHLFPAQYYVVVAKVLSFSNIKLVFTEHNTTNRRLENKIFKFVDKWIYKFYTKIVAISPQIKDMLNEHTKFKDDTIQTIENGVPIQNIIEALPLDRKKINPAFDEKDILIIQVAGFREQKNQECLIRSIALLPEKCKLILVGDGSTKERCTILVNKLKLHSRVFFLGIRVDIPNLLKTADVVVLSSHFEGMSLSSIEGMISGKPFVASNVPGLHEMVNGHGILFENDNEEELAKHIIKLMENEQYYQQIVVSCMQHAIKFDIKIMVNKHLELYSKIYGAKKK